MTIIHGDLLKIEHGIILHQVNALKITGGLAGALHRKFPRAFRGYFNDARQPKLGTALLCNQDEDLLIAHIYGQYYPGPNTDLEAVDHALQDLKSQLSNRQHPLPIYAPFCMGCGLGGGDWPSYLALLEKHFPDITIVQKYP